MQLLQVVWSWVIDLKYKHVVIEEIYKRLDTYTYTFRIRYLNEVIAVFLAYILYHNL